MGLIAQTYDYSNYRVADHKTSYTIAFLMYIPGF